MRVLITGASGFLGSHVAEQLVESGHQVRCLVRRSSQVAHLSHPAIELAYGTVDAADSLPAAMQDVDAVVHCAGVVKARNADEFDAVNHQGTRNLLEATERHAPGVRRFVHVSSAAIMGAGAEGRPHRRDTVANPSTEYGRSKLAAEGAARAFADRLPITVLRPPAIYGPRDTEMFAFFQMVSFGIALRLADYKSMSLVYGPDVARACIDAIDVQVPSGSSFFVTDGRSWTFDQMADAVADAMGVETWARPGIPSVVLRAAAHASEAIGRWTNKAMMFNRDKVNELSIEHFAIDIDDTVRELGWSPRVEFPEGAKRTAQWYRANGWL